MLVARIGGTTPPIHFEKSGTRRAALQTIRWTARLDNRMGRRAKGDRHKIVASMPPRAAEMVKAEAAALGCFIGDYLGWLVSEGVGIAQDPPIGHVTDHPDPSPTNDTRVRYAAMVPRTAANSVMELAEQRGITMGDVVTDLICVRFAVPFRPRVMKKAAKAGERLPMTG